MLFASGVKINDALRDPIFAIRKKSQGRLHDALGGIQPRQAASNTASGRVMGEYAPAELARAEEMASGGIDDALLGALGGSSYDELLKQKAHDQNLALVREIGSLNKPGSMQELLAALGLAAKTGGSIYGASQGRRNSMRSGYSKNPSYGLSNALNYGYGDPSIPDFDYGVQYPSELRRR